MYTQAAMKAANKYKRDKLKRIALEVSLDDYAKIVDYANGRPIATVLKEIIKEKLY